MKTILSIFGTRPEAIKMAPVVKVLEENSNFKSLTCVTAQHRQMLDQVLNIFDIKPHFDLDIMQEDQDLFTITNKVLSNLKDIILANKPDLILTHGDTTTTLAASLAAYYLQIPVGHIEAGLRTYNKYAPFPEELNRQITDKIADYHFVPTNWAKQNLLSEGILEKSIFITGNTVIDALQHALKKIRENNLEETFIREFNFLLDEKKFILITGHRRESFGSGFQNICLAIRQLAKTFPEINFVYPVHLNPHVRSPVETILLSSGLTNFYFLEPLDYLPFTYLMSRAYFILTDSGGIQEEAISLNKPALIMRAVTERPEGVDVGAVKMIGNNAENIFQACKELLTDQALYCKMINKKNPYGDGQAAQKITQILSEKLLAK